jgi:hypothetical protein
MLLLLLLLFLQLQPKLLHRHAGFLGPNCCPNADEHIQTGPVLLLARQPRPDDDMKEK